MPFLIQHRGHIRRPGDRSLNVFVDGEAARAVKHGDDLALDLEPGVHTIQLANRWDCSDTLSFDYDGGDHCVEVGLTMRGEDSGATILNRMIRGAELYFKPIRGFDRIWTSERTRRQGASIALMKWVFVSSALVELKVFAVLAVPAAIAIAFVLALR